MRSTYNPLSNVNWGEKITLYLVQFSGSLLSIPITTAIKIGCENIPALRPISVLMGSGRKTYLEDKTRKNPEGK